MTPMKQGFDFFLLLEKSYYRCFSPCLKHLSIYIKNEKAVKSGFIKTFTFAWFMCTCKCVCIYLHMRVSRCANECQRTACRSWFSPSTILAPSIGLGLAGLAARAFTRCTILLAQTAFLAKNYGTPPFIPKASSCHSITVLPPSY